MYEIGPNLTSILNTLIGIIFIWIIVWATVSLGRLLLEWWKRR